MVAVLVPGAAVLSGANLFLAALAAGSATATISPDAIEAFHRFGETIGELMKLVGMLLFGALLSLGLFAELSAFEYVFAGLTLFAVRPVAMGLAMLGTRLSVRERATILWFGPRGFASVAYALLVAKSGLRASEELFDLAALVILASIVVHSSTDTLVARSFAGDDGGEGGRRAAVGQRAGHEGDHR